MKKDPSLSETDVDLLASFKPQSGADLTEVALNFKATQLAEAFKGRLPTRVELKDISKELGVELANAVFLKAVQDSDGHGPFLKKIRDNNKSRFNSRSIAGNSGMEPTEILFTSSSSFQSGRIWGDHVEEWRAWARELGYQTDCINTQARSSVTANARWVRNWLTMNPHPRRILVTYGQGTSEIRYMIQRAQARGFDGRPNEQVGLIAWLNICGSFHGSTSSDYLSSGLMRGVRTQLAMMMKNRSALTLWETSRQFQMWKSPMKIPRGLVVASLIGVPFRSQIPMGLHSLYNELVKDGPNDGVVGVHEAIVPGGFVVPISGMSHRAESVKLKPVFQRALGVISGSLEETPAKSLELY